MRFKGTLVLLVTVIVFGSYIYFYEMKGTEQREKAKQAESQIWKFEGKNVVQIDLISPDSRITAQRKSDQTWSLSAPQSWDADADELNRLADSGATITRETVVDSNATDLARFGLQPPLFGLRFRTKDGKEFGIDFGSNNPTGASTYAILAGKKEVFLVPAAAASSFNRKVEDVRDHTVLKFDRAAIQALSIKNPQGGMDITKDASDRWWFKGTDRRAADGPEVRGILNAISMAKVKEFSNAAPQDYVNPGLDKPFIEVTITPGGGRPVRRLVIGTEKSRLQKRSAEESAAGSANASSEALYLAQDTARPEWFFVDKELVDKLRKSASDIREKALVSFQRWDVDSMFLTNSKGIHRFVKAGGEWFLAGTSKKVRWDAVNGILDALEKPVREWIDKPAALSTYGLDKPLMRIVLKQGGAVLADCAFGSSAKDGLYARVAGDSSIKVADPDGLNMLDKGEADYVEPAAAIPSKK